MTNNAGYPTTQPSTIKGSGMELDVEHVLYFPTVTANGKAQTLRKSHTPKPLGLVKLTLRNDIGEVIGEIQISTVELRAALSASRAMA